MKEGLARSCVVLEGLVISTMLRMAAGYRRNTVTSLFEESMMELQLLHGCLLAMVLGVFGQGLRAVAGLKKQADEASTNGKKLGEVFDQTTFWTSLLMGAIAGMAGFLGMKYGSADGADFSKGTTILGIVAAGYSGADFIEAFAKKYLPK